MNYYTNQHKYYCGVDLHAKSLYVCILDTEGKACVHRKIRNDGEYFVKMLEPYKEDVVVGVECMFSWYWLADLCVDKEIPFVLGHALYMKAIHGGKAKNDKIDSRKIAGLLRGGMFPQAYVYPRDMRSTRDLMRRRIKFARKRSEVLAHLQILRIQNNLPSFEASLKAKCNRARVASQFQDLAVRRSVELDIEALGYYDEMLRCLELDITNITKAENGDTFHKLKTVPGIGRLLAITILYEMHTVERFPTVGDFISYCRLVKCKKESAGKCYGTTGAKIGNAYLKWAFTEAAGVFIRDSEEAYAFFEKLKIKHSSQKALGIIAAKLARAVYFMLKRNRSFDMKKFFE